MADQEARYDRIAEGYAAWWSPVHRPATLAVLDDVQAATAGDGSLVAARSRLAGTPVARGKPRILDVGCGTGALAAAAVARWPGALVTGIDVSSGMLAVAERELSGLDARDRRRITLVQAAADRLPFDDGAFDIVVSAFVLQLVPSRYRALREARRVLVRGGTLAHVTWLAGGSLPADDAYAAALSDAGLEPRDPGPARDEPSSATVAAAQLRRAGFAGASAHESVLDHQFTPEGYLEFLARFDDEDLFAGLETSRRAELEADILARLKKLPPDGLRMRLPIAYASGRRATG
jgi:SAM-dependent methyltransferase